MVTIILNIKKNINKFNLVKLFFYYRIIASKNVTIVLRDLSDLKYYTTERFIWAAIISKEWFNIISKLNLDEIANLKNDLNGFTLNGEYCGNYSFNVFIKNKII